MLVTSFTGQIVAGKKSLEVFDSIGFHSWKILVLFENHRIGSSNYLQENIKSVQLQMILKW